MKKKKTIISLRLTLYDNDDSESFVNYLISNYGKPKILEPEPSQTEKGKPFGGAAYLWKDVLPNRSIVLSKNYNIRRGEWCYDININIVPTESTEKFDVDDVDVNTLEFLVLTNSFKARVALGKSHEDLKAYINNNESD